MRGSRRRGSLLIGLFAVLIAAAVIAGCGGSSGTSSTTTEESKETAEAPDTKPAEPEEEESEEGIAAAPEFTSEELNEEPTENWVTNGGNLTNDRFSTLSEINTENVKELKGDWMTKIGQNATAAKFSAEGQALENKGTIYISDGADDVFAMDVGTGKVLWTYE